MYHSFYTLGHSLRKRNLKYVAAVDGLAIWRMAIFSNVESSSIMRDPHVEWLEYEMKTNCLFDNPLPVEWETPVFQANLENGILRAEMRKHFATLEDARGEAELFLQTWEIDMALHYGQREITFVFKQANVIDRTPPPPGSTVITGTAASLAFATSSVTLRVTRKRYPAVPSNFIATPDVVTLWNRFEGFKQGREPLAAMAYFCFTLVMYFYGETVDAASNVLAVDKNVLKTISRLSSTRGDLSTARKMEAGLKPLAATEAQWLEAAIRALIRRLGEIASGNTPSKFTMTHLPPL